MSVTFWNPENPAEYNDDYEHVGGGMEYNLSNTNARELLDFLGVETEDDLCGSILAKDLEVVCRRKLMVMSAKGEDPEIPETALRTVPGSRESRATFIMCRREAGYLVNRTMDLLALAQQRKSDTDKITWG